MPDTLTLEQLRTEWHLGDDSVGKNALKALTAADITPTAAAAMTARQLEDVPGLGATRLARVREHLHLMAAEAARSDRTAAIEAAKEKPGHCPECGGRRAQNARSVVRDVWGHLRSVNPAINIHLDDCQSCETYHRDLVTSRAAELAGSIA